MTNSRFRVDLQLYRYAMLHGDGFAKANPVCANAMDVAIGKRPVYAHGQPRHALP